MRYSDTPKRSDRSINFFAWENVVRQIKKLYNLKFDSSQFNVFHDPSGWYISIRKIGTGGETKTWAFENSINSTSNTWTVDIEQGHFTVQGDTDYPVNKLTYNLPDANVASNAYSVVTFDIASRVAEVKILPTYPTPTASQVLVPLVGYSSNSTTGVWTEEIIYHRGNINFATSIVFG